MNKRIGIIGAGTAGLHLGLFLRQHDVDVTIFLLTAHLKPTPDCAY
ncbi:hypothetical protein ACFS07_19445 [Undibacterium arcticum]